MVVPRLVVFIPLVGILLEWPLLVRDLDFNGERELCRAVRVGHESVIPLVSSVIDIRPYRGRGKRDLAPLPAHPADVQGYFVFVSLAGRARLDEDKLENLRGKLADGGRRDVNVALGCVSQEMRATRF